MYARRRTIESGGLVFAQPSTCDNFSHFSPQDTPFRKLFEILLFGSAVCPFSDKKIVH